MQCMVVHLVGLLICVFYPRLYIIKVFLFKTWYYLCVLPSFGNSRTQLMFCCNFEIMKSWLKLFEKKRIYLIKKRLNFYFV
jgi:hypothetical protein